MKAENKKNIEEYLAELSDISARLNDSAVSLDEAVELYKKGMKTAAQAQELLNAYEQEIEIINNNNLNEGGIPDE
jgi:exodeoxyribonuclease VII small subunit